MQYRARITHPDKTLKSLGIDSEVLDEVCGADIPTTFWTVHVDPGCILRKVAVRVLCGKPTSIAVERLWSAFGDTLTAKRRSVGNANLCKLVYVKMNAHLVHNSLLPELSPTVSSFVEHDETLMDMVEFAEQADAEQEIEFELASLLAGPGQPVQGSTDDGQAQCDAAASEGSEGSWT